jgi:uncharacterized membrane-anchored protein
MINLNEEDWFLPGVKHAQATAGNTALQLALIIDGAIVDFIGVRPDLAEKFLNSSSITDIGEVDPGVFEFHMDGETVRANEKTYSIMVSDPIIVHVTLDVQRHADKAEPGWLYQGGQFIIPGVYE